MSQRREVAQFISELRREGLTVEPTRSGHYTVLIPDGGRVVLASSPSDPRWRRNSIALLRRNGFQFGGKAA